MKTFQAQFVVGMFAVSILFTMCYLSLAKVKSHKVVVSLQDKVADQQSKPQKLKTAPTPSITQKVENKSTIIVLTNTGLRRVMTLHDSRMTVEVPFSSYYVMLSVVPGRDVASVQIKHKTTRSSKYILGLGVTTTQVSLYYNHKKRPGLHRVNLIRKNRVVKYRSGETCYLEQDCDLIIYEQRKCGPQAMKYWEPSESVEGYWKLNCTNCSLEQTCLWSKAEWIATNSSVEPLHGDEVKTCLQGYQVLFLGDSTNRGLMQSFMEKVNTTLTHAVFTHGTLVYDSIGLSTSVCFTYYNPTLRENTATFAGSLQHLANKCFPRRSGEKTLLVVGGIQWLKSEHLKELKAFATSKSIPAGNVYLKLPGAGIRKGTYDVGLLQKKFPVKKMMEDNDMLRNSATSLGFGVVDIMQMTLSRFKEFRFGSCACHFHEIKKYSVNHNFQTLYHIDGEINERYAEILISKMCSS